MKVVHITKLPDGGATWCAMRLSEALRRVGIDSSLFLMQGEPSENVEIAEPDFIYKTRKNIIARFIFKIFKLLYRPSFERLTKQRKIASKDLNTTFTSPVTEYSNIIYHPTIKNADIVHLHWISDFVDFPTFFKNAKKPIVWTAHDENPGLGGFHYDSAKRDASDKLLSLDKKYSSIKRHAIASGAKPHLVALSSKMKDFLEQSDIFKDCKIATIHNGVDGDVFQMKDKIESRKNLGFSSHEKVFLFSSYNITDKRKGLQLLIEALEQIKIDNIVLVCLGNYTKIPSSSINVRCVGLITDKDQLSEYYTAADFFVLSSFQEAFAQTPLESMACGTPVIAFPCSGIPELINDNNGVICEDFSVPALVKGINKAFEKNYIREEIRTDVLSRFSWSRIAAQYVDLYKRVVK